MKKVMVVLAAALVLLVTTTAASANPNHVQTFLKPVGGSHVAGIVDLQQRPNNGGTHITLVGFGLTANDQFVSLYYDNHSCQLEPYSVDDVIGGIYTANRVGVGATQGNADDNLNEINSVSIRHAGDFHLLACADVHPAQR
ncbi:MAG: hypothetical protein U0822_15790 [Anaerolineae bacterium]